MSRGLIRYMKAKNVKIDILSAINQEYASGQDSRADFVAAIGGFDAGKRAGRAQ